MTQETWHPHAYGARVKEHLPPTVDSVRERKGYFVEELQPGRWFQQRPAKGYAPLHHRIYHAWLVLTNRAGAVQFARDHFESAGVPMHLPEMTCHKYCALALNVSEGAAERQPAA